MASANRSGKCAPAAKRDSWSPIPDRHGLQRGEAVQRFEALLAAGVYRGTDELTALWQAERRFLPTLPPQRAAELMARWEHAVRQATLA